jgi:hypothetical protein
MLTGVRSLITYEAGMLTCPNESLYTQERNVDKRMASRYILDRNVDRCMASRYVRDINVDKRVESRYMRSIVPLLTMATDRLFPCTELQSIQTGIYIMRLRSAKVCQIKLYPFSNTVGS